jgi:hypothetical protein
VGNLSESKPKDTQFLLKALDRVLDFEASPEDRLLGDVIRTLARYSIHAQTTTSDADLAFMLAVSVALNRRRS